MNTLKCVKLHSALVAIIIPLVAALTLVAKPSEAAPFAYVTNEGDATVTIIDTATNSVVGSPIPMGDTPRGIAITPNGARAYVTNVGGNSVMVIDTVLSQSFSV